MKADQPTLDDVVEKMEELCEAVKELQRKTHENTIAMEELLKLVSKPWR